jgi:hypothetical protein
VIKKLLGILVFYFPFARRISLDILCFLYIFSTENKKMKKL